MRSAVRELGWGYGGRWDMGSAPAAKGSAQDKSYGESCHLSLGKFITLVALNWYVVIEEVWLNLQLSRSAGRTVQVFSQGHFLCRMAHTPWKKGLQKCCIIIGLNFNCKVLRLMSFIFTVALICRMIYVSIQIISKEAKHEHSFRSGGLRQKCRL